MATGDDGSTVVGGLHHVGITVRDLGVSIHFYRDLLGLEVTFSGRFGGPLYEAVMGTPEASGTVATLRGGGVRVELFEFEVPRSPSASAHRVETLGLMHFCLKVTDIHRVYRELGDAGVHFDSTPINFGDEIYATYARDPDGNVIELLQMPDRMEAMRW